MLAAVPLLVNAMAVVLGTSPAHLNDSYMWAFKPAVGMKTRLRIEANLTVHSNASVVKAQFTQVRLHRVNRVSGSGESQVEDEPVECKSSIGASSITEKASRIPPSTYQKSLRGLVTSFTCKAERDGTGISAILPLMYDAPGPLVAVKAGESWRCVSTINSTGVRDIRCTLVGVEPYHGSPAIKVQVTSKFADATLNGWYFVSPDSGRLLANHISIRGYSLRGASGRSADLDADVEFEQDGPSGKP